MQTRQTLTLAALSSLLVSGALIAPAHAGETPFSAKPMAGAYQLAQADMEKKADGKCGEAKCGADKKAAEKMSKKHDGKCGEAKCGADKKAAAMADKKADGSCGGDKKADAGCGAKK